MNLAPTRFWLRRAALPVAAALALGFSAQAASAQPPTVDRPSARSKAGAGDKKEALRRLAEGDKRLRRGDRHAARGNIERAFRYFEAALAQYEAAYQAYPDPQIFFPIAQAEQRLGRFVDALHHYEELLAESGSLSAALRNQVQIHLDAVRRNLAAVSLEIEPPGADILIDGTNVGRSPLSEPLFVEPGQHDYTVMRNGYLPLEGRLDLLPGKLMRKRIQLERAQQVSEPLASEPLASEPLASEPQASEPQASEPSASGRESSALVLNRPAARQAPEDRPERPNALPLWIGVGVTGALAIGGTVTGFAALSKHETYVDESASQSEREDARQDGKRLATITDVLLGGALLGGAVTATYYFTQYRPRSREADRAGPSGREREPLSLGSTWRALPLVDRDTAGLVLSGSFW